MNLPAHRLFPRPKVHPGFTLIELLVVIAIIALLAAILFPVFSRVRENARKATCQSNMKQIALGFQQYTQDFDGRFPHDWDMSDPTKLGAGVTNPQTGLLSTTSTNDPVLWPAKIEPYLKSRQIFTCPSFTVLEKKGCATGAFGKKRMWQDGDPTLCSSSTCISARDIGYGYNSSYIGGGLEPNAECMSGYFPSGGTGPIDYTTGVGALDSEIANPASTLLIVDNNWENKGQGRAATFANIIATIGSNQRDIYGGVWCNADGVTFEDADTYDPRHNDGMNVAFADGHVKWMKKEDVLYTPSGVTIPCSGLATSTTTDPRFIWNRF